MLLSQLEAEFLILKSLTSFERTHDITKAQGIVFLCPKCYAANGGSVGTHSIICWFADRGVPADQHPSPGRWHIAGTGYNDLTFVSPGQTSVQCVYGCLWHGLLINGNTIDAT